jgi:hypothetical protein
MWWNRNKRVTCKVVGERGASPSGMRLTLLGHKGCFVSLITMKKITLYELKRVFEKGHL